MCACPLGVRTCMRVFVSAWCFVRARKCAHTVLCVFVCMCVCVFISMCPCACEGTHIIAVRLFSRVVVDLHSELPSEHAIYFSFFMFNVHHCMPYRLLRAHVRKFAMRVTWQLVKCPAHAHSVESASFNSVCLSKWRMKDVYTFLI